MTAEKAPTWDDVLAECEASAAHAEALLRSRTHEPIRPRPPARSLQELTAHLGEPSAEVIGRARALQAEHLRLQRELAHSMLDIEHQSLLLGDGTGPVPRAALYLDRKV